MDENRVGFDRCQVLVETLQHAGGQAREALIGSHHIKIGMHGDFKAFANLPEHFPMLAGGYDVGDE